MCHVRGLGHVAVVVPYEPINGKGKESRKWILALAIGSSLIGLVLIVVVGVEIYKLVKRKQIRGMEREAERSVPLTSIWIMQSRMPAASGIRTQPELENNYVP